MDGIERPQDNRYVARLGLAGAPSVEAAYVRIGPQFLRLMVVAIIERGAPLDLGQMVDRLAKAGVRSRIGDLGVSIQKAWAGRSPIYRDTQGRFDLDLQADDLGYILRDLALLPTAPRLEPIIAPTPAPLPIGAPDEPLSKDEVTAAFRDASLYGLAAFRQVAAVLEAFGWPQSMEAVEGILHGFTKWRFSFDPTRVPFWKTPLVGIGDDGLLHLNPGCPEVLALRETVRRMAAPRLAQETSRLRAEAISKAMRAREEHARAAEAAQEQARTHAILRVVYQRGEAPSCAALLDVERRAIRTFLPAEMGELSQALRAYDVLSGLDVREALEMLREDPHDWRLEELRPLERTWKLNRSGRRLKITFELASGSTTGITRPLGKPEDFAAHIVKGASGRIRRRLESDVKALYAFRQYAVLHGYVRLRWGFLDEFLFLDWASSRRAPLLPELRAAMEARERLEVVVGGAPGWSDPWSRAHPCTVTQILEGHAVLAFPGQPYAEMIPFVDIQALRPLTERQDGSRSGPRPAD